MGDEKKIGDWRFVICEQREKDFFTLITNHQSQIPEGGL
jgi:hypothetical protein